MTKTKFSKILSFVLCFVLIAAITLVSSGCNDKTNSDPSSSNPISSNASSSDDSVLGQGETKFTVNINTR